MLIADYEAFNCSVKILIITTVNTTANKKIAK